MLVELTIENFAIIEHLHLNLQGGFTVLTGETGAGKSIIIDALGTLRGEKVSPTFVRSGSKRARIEGIFTLDDCPSVIPILQEYDLWHEEDEQVVLTREISAESGRSVARLNQRAINTSILREVGSKLMDIHGQHEGLSIFDTRTHLDILDRYGGTLALREQVSAAVTRLRHLRDELDELQRSEDQRVERIEELRVLIEEVQAANLHPEEEQELTRERTLLQNAATIAELIGNAYTLLYTGDESGVSPLRPIVASMAHVSDDLNELANLDPAATSIAEQATDLLYHLEDLATQLRGYRDRFDFDPNRLETIEDRLALIRSIKRKYRCEIAELLERAANAETEIDRLQHSNEYIETLEAQQDTLLREIGDMAGELSSRRCVTGDTLAQEVERAMGDLAMPHVKFAVTVDQVEDSDGVPSNLGTPEAGTKTYRLLPGGIDQVEFLLSPNPGEPLKSLVRIASGGESARLLLALKSILSHADTIPTLIFDEIEIGVGGRAGQVIGQKLWDMTENHQVFCITHLPQVAAFADSHYAISKHVDSSLSGDLKTHTTVCYLTAEERIDELAAMLDGTPLSEHSRASAREMIERALVFKYSNTGVGPSCNDRNN